MVATRLLNSESPSSGCSTYTWWHWASEDGSLWQSWRIQISSAMPTSCHIQTLLRTDENKTNP